MDNHADGAVSTSDRPSTMPVHVEPLQIPMHEAARLLSYDPRTVRRLAARGELWFTAMASYVESLWPVFTPISNVTWLHRQSCPTTHTCLRLRSCEAVFSPQFNSVPVTVKVALAGFALPMKGTTMANP